MAKTRCLSTDTRRPSTDTRCPSKVRTIHSPCPFGLDVKAQAIQPSRSNSTTTVQKPSGLSTRRHSALTQLYVCSRASKRRSRGTDCPACLDFERRSGKKVADARPVPKARQGLDEKSAGRRPLPPTRAQVALTTPLCDLGTATDLCHKVTACLQSRRDSLHDARRKPKRQAKATACLQFRRDSLRIRRARGQAPDEPGGRCQTSPRAGARLDSNTEAQARCKYRSKSCPHLHCLHLKSVRFNLQINSN